MRILSSKRIVRMYCMKKNEWCKRYQKESKRDYFNYIRSQDRRYDTPNIMFMSKSDLLIQNLASVRKSFTYNTLDEYDPRNLKL